MHSSTKPTWAVWAFDQPSSGRPRSLAVSVRTTRSGGHWDVHRSHCWSNPVCPVGGSSEKERILPGDVPREIPRTGFGNYVVQHDLGACSVWLDDSLLLKSFFRKFNTKVKSLLSPMGLWRIHFVSPAAIRWLWFLSFFFCKIDMYLWYGSLSSFSSSSLFFFQIELRLQDTMCRFHIHPEFTFFLDSTMYKTPLNHYQLGFFPYAITFPFKILLHFLIQSSVI